MSFTYIKEIPSPKQIYSDLPLPAELQTVKAARDAEISAVLEGKSKKFILIVGPCSADYEDAVLEYVLRISKVQQQVSDRIVIIPRVYTNKPRTMGEGYKGMLHQPIPTEKSNLYEGILAIRRLHINAIKEAGLTCADEMLYPENYAYLDDLLGYVAIGARSVENQQHRLTVSGVDVPVGMKNATGGDLSIMFNAIRAAQVGHEFIFRGWEVETKGNPLSHGILRGAVNHYGRTIPNYHYEDLVFTYDEYMKRGLLNPGIIVDTNHANSNKQYKEQPRIAYEILENMRYDSRMRDMIKGLMIESYLVEGSQDVAGKTYGQSITDPCLGFEDTETLIYRIAELLPV